MASGKKNYFRHSTTAFEDPKIQKAIELLGFEGYAFYFILLELFAKQCENEVKNPIIIHQQTVRIVLRKSQQSCHKVVRKLEESGLFVVTFTESFYEFHIPNLSKYLGKYDTKFQPNYPNKKKEKENKIKEIKNTKKVTPDEVIQVYNETVRGKLKPFSAHLAGTALHKFFEASQYLQTLDDWKKLFEKVLQSDFLLGRTDSKWIVNFLWLVDYDNALKVISGNFDNEQADYSYLFEGIKDA